MDSAEHLKRGPDHDVAGRLRIDGEIQPRLTDVLAGIAVGSVAEGSIERELSLDRLPTVEGDPALQGRQHILRGALLPITGLGNFKLSECSGQ